MKESFELPSTILESYTVDGMPDDFTRLLWLSLPLSTDDSGRGLDHPGSLRSLLFPFASGGEEQERQLREGMDYLERQGMLIRFQGPVGERYFELANWPDGH